MILNQFEPQEKFEKYVESLVYFKGYTPEHSIEKIVPDGSINLIFELDGFLRHVFDNETLAPKLDFTRVWFSGVHRNLINISTHKDSSMFVVRFKPAGAYPFLRKSVSKFTDTVLPAEDVFGDEIFEIRDAILAASGPEDKKKIVDDWLNEKFDETKTPKDAIYTSIQKIINDPHFQENNLAELIEESGYSQKQFINLFKEYVGVAPKYFQRIVRFNEILVKIHADEKLSWTEISYDCGFYDQAHFIKEFQHFCGVNPETHLENPLIDERVNFFPVD